MEDEVPFLDREDEGPRMGKLRKALHHSLVCTQKVLSEKRFMDSFGKCADEESLRNAYEALHLQLLLNMEVRSVASLLAQCCGVGLEGMREVAYSWWSG